MNEPKYSIALLTDLIPVTKSKIVTPLIISIEIFQFLPGTRLLKNKSKLTFETLDFNKKDTEEIRGYIIYNELNEIVSVNTLRDYLHLESGITPEFDIDNLVLEWIIN